MSPRTGRPKVEHPRVNAVPIRLSDEELAVIKNAADAAGAKVGEYIRTKALAAAKRSK